MKRLSRISAWFVIGLAILLSSSLTHAQCMPETAIAPPASVCPLPACAPPPPPFCPIAGLAFTDPITLTWLAAPAGCPMAYDLAKGDLDVLRGTCQPVFNTCDICVALEDSDPVIGAVDATPDPPVGHGWWYLVRADIPGFAVGSYNTPAASQCTDYDPDPAPATSCVP